MDHKTEKYKIAKENSSMAKEPVALYGYQTVPMSHVQMSFDIDVPKGEDLETFKLRVIAFAEYLSSKEKHSVLDKAIRRINKLMLLDDNWDGYGSSQVNVMAAKNARNIVAAMDVDTLNILRITPTETGTISLRLLRGANDSIGINCDKDTMSYFIERKQTAPEFYSDIKYSPLNIKTLMRRVKEW